MIKNRHNNRIFFPPGNYLNFIDFKRYFKIKNAISKRIHAKGKSLPESFELDFSQVMVKKRDVALLKNRHYLKSCFKEKIKYKVCFTSCFCMTYFEIFFVKDTSQFQLFSISIFNF